MNKVGMLRFTVVLITLCLAACHPQAIKHNPVRAAFDTNRFLKALCFDQDFAGALNLADEPLQQFVSAERLGRMVEENNQKWGALTRLRADSYLMTLGRTMELFYDGEYQKGVLYYRLVLVGDASTGYKVSGIWFQPDPYPENTLRRKFNVAIVIDSPSSAMSYQ
jgi:hypothetical protein